MQLTKSSSPTIHNTSIPISWIKRLQIRTESFTVVAFFLLYFLVQTDLSKQTSEYYFYFYFIYYNDCFLLKHKALPISVLTKCNNNVVNWTIPIVLFFIASTLKHSMLISTKPEIIKQPYIISRVLTGNS